MNRKGNASGRVALCGIIAALATVCMMLTIVPISTYALPALAGALLIPVVIELGAASGWMTYAGVSILTLLLSRNMEANILFILFFGYYPIVKGALERRLGRGRLRVVEWLVKVGVFNAAIVASYALLILAFNLPADEFAIGGVNVAWLFLVVGNLVFVIYDLALTRALTGYVMVLHPRVAKMFRLK